jgi:hypothetical protein
MGFCPFWLFPKASQTYCLTVAKYFSFDVAYPRITLGTIETGSTAGLKQAGFFVLA